MDQAHATTIEINGNAIMLIGPSGAGKSDLALRLIDGGAKLVADDRTSLAVTDGVLFATPPQPLAGKLEVRGFGIVDVPHISGVPVRLVAELVPPAQVERMPEDQTMEFLGVHVPLILLCGFEASATAKLRMVLEQVTS